MLAKVHSCAVVGLDAEPIHVELAIASGLARITLVGLPDAALRESGERVRAAITNSGFFFPQHRLTINLASADLRKERPAYDLPMAVGILAATRQVMVDQRCFPAFNAHPCSVQPRNSEGTRGSTTVTQLAAEPGDPTASLPSPPTLATAIDLQFEGVPIHSTDSAKRKRVAITVPKRINKVRKTGIS